MAKEYSHPPETDLEKTDELPILKDVVFDFDVEDDAVPLDRTAVLQGLPLHAAAGMPNDPSVMQKTANALVKSGGDMHQAVELAKKAVALAPKRIEARLTLIEVYIAAGLPLAAKRELEQAREIAPRDDRMMELSKRLK